jgi:trimeric autotransporter adhesin
MSRFHIYLCAGLLLICCALPASAQQAAVTATNAVVPPITKFSGTLSDAKGAPLTSTMGVTFALYQNEQGGAPLWVETQNVTPDKSGHYTVTLGSASSQGLPANLFASGEARWLGVQMQGQEERPRVMLMSVPYALKALDAETIGGKPASSFMLAPTGNASTSGSNAPAGTITGSGKKNFVPLFTGMTTIGDSNIFETAAGNVGIGTITPSGKLDVNGTGDFRDTMTLFPKGTHPTLSIHGTAFAVSNTGVVSFVSGQTFPGTGTVKTVNSGAGLTGGPIHSTGTLSIANGGVTNTMLQNSSLTVPTSSPLQGGGSISLGGSGTAITLKSCAASQILEFTGGAWSCVNIPSGGVSDVAAGTDIIVNNPTGPTATVNLDTTKVPQLAAANSFTNNNKILGAGSGFALVITQPTATNGGAGTPALESAGADADPNGLQVGGVGVTAFGGNGGTANVSGAGGNAINSFGGSAGNGNGGVGISAAGGFGVGGDSVSTGSGGAGVVATGGDSDLFFGGDGIDATGGAGGQGNNFSSTSGNGVVATGGQGGFQEADGTGGFFTGGTAGGFGGFGIEVFAGSDSAAFFEGDIVVTGAISAGTKDFKIDHPLDPANKYLAHASIESSEMINIYTGNVTTDSQGDAQVRLPDWFEAVNTDFRYQLTVIGQFAQAIVNSRVSNHQFGIKTDKPNVDVSWQIAGVRQDAFAKAHPLVVEQEKNARERGFYLHPELYGAPQDKGMGWAHHPLMMKRMQEQKSRPRRPAIKRATLAKNARPAK